MDLDALVHRLTQVGLTRNQSLAWLTLLRDDSEVGLTGYEVSSRSGVPRSAIYKVVQQLEEVGAIFAIGTDPQRFLAASPDQWLARQQARNNERFEALAEALQDLPRPNRPEPIWVIRQYGEVLAHIDELVRSAEQSVYLHLWPREVEALWPAFQAIAERPLHRVLHSPAPLPRCPPGFRCWSDTPPDPDKATWSHKALVVVDRSRAVIGGTEPGVDNDAVSTQNASLVDVATNHIILDITLLAQRTSQAPLEDVASMMRPYLPR